MSMTQEQDVLKAEKPRKRIHRRQSCVDSRTGRLHEVEGELWRRLLRMGRAVR